MSFFIAAVASSIPDTILSFYDAKKGQFDDAFSNAFGSNIFDANGKSDLLVMNNGVGSKTKCDKYKGFKGCKNNLTKQSESYVLFNHGVSGLKKGTLKIPNEVINFTATADLDDKSLRLYVGHGADLNNDGRADLVISNHKNLFIIESSIFQ